MADTTITYSTAVPLAPLDTIAVAHSAPGSAPATWALDLLIEATRMENATPVLVMHPSTRDAFSASVRDLLGFPVAPDVDAYRGARFELDDTVPPGTVIAYRWEEFEIIHSRRRPAVPDVPDLLAYLEARWAEEEAAAKDASPGPWSSRHPEDPDLHMYGNYGWYVEGPAGSPEVEDSEQGKADADHIAYWNPARVLADLTAKRALLAWLTRDGHRATNNWDTAQFKCSTLDDPADDCDCGHDQTMTTILAPFAQAYTARPDFPEEWRG